MTIENHSAELVAIEDTALETVAGGYEHPAMGGFGFDLTKIDVELVTQSNVATVTNNAFLAGGYEGDVALQITQLNTNG